jgi:Ca2+-binding EF-hand superfamily protein
VSKKEVKAILTDMGLSEEDADSISTRIMESADADGNDKLSLDEFKKELCA